ncbi:type II toxin-antitoxin system HicB family antitoxin [Limnofasciculus baicalensis]|uniref:Type II toxin-antitoxin system HicB family antitoxin n=1 Tax=Limnofasciculus baicalensis BBK-W-15 TaxID=2699891 RepID=A0AAE3GYU3_9CYAN|nr:type II toxin-antitoxin system HicB family antitoxin [Limnofasciculus baicalensis]MCP2732306.1 type II toxin-antitoxin system HicB family antitoxin [Limnofasciculus baicalensis BBK-W-15]
MNYHYTIIIQWSDEDQCYIVFLPEFEDVMQPCTHGDTYEEALKNAKEVIEMLIETILEEGKTLPQLKQFTPGLQVA